MKIAMTGAAGHVGSAVLPELIGRGHQVRVLRNQSEIPLSSYPVEVVRGNILDIPSLSLLMEGCDALIHAAAIISIQGDPSGMVRQTNVEGTRLVLQAAKKAGIKRVVHISSIHAYQQYPVDKVLDEQRVLVGDQAFAYDRSKREGQEMALSMNGPDFEVLVMNPTSVIGPMDYRPSKMGHVLIDLYTGKLPFVIQGGFDFCDVRDVASAIANALVSGRPGENYLLGGTWHSLWELVEIISLVTGKTGKTISLPPVLGWMGLPVVQVLSWIKKSEPIYTREALTAIVRGNKMICSQKAKQELQYHCRPLEETVRDTLQWFRQNGYLVKSI